MTTERDRGDLPAPQMVRCDENPSHVYTPLHLALRDMRRANGRDLVTGAGTGNESWTGLALGMIVLDSMTGSTGEVGERWRRLLTKRSISSQDADLIYAIRNAVLHGYYFPKPAKAAGRIVVYTGSQDAPALDTETDGHAQLSVPIFCGRLVERVAAESSDSWDTSLISTNYQLPT